jgi:hypothetical protein
MNAYFSLFIYQGKPDEIVLVIAIRFQVISRVGDLVGIKYFPAEPPKIAGAGHDKLE